MKNTQKQRLLSYLSKGGTINRTNSLNELGILELSARIGNLERDGYKIEKDWIVKTNRFNEKYRLRTYKLQDCRETKLS